MCDVVCYDCDTQDAIISCSSKKRKHLDTLTQLAKKPSVDIDFRDLTYSVRTLKGGKKIVLDSVSGCFRAGEMTAILGPSGAGKSSLLNILAGYVSSGVTGQILTNGLPRQKKAFHKLSHYIMQEDLLQPRLTVNEAVNFAADLKLSSSLLPEEKSSVVEEVLTVLCLQSCRDTFTEKLSGGERRRISIALELVNNPAVLLLDEPTTGLDVSAARKCLEVLKVLADHGRTIICTLHQPSASDLNMFDNVYLMSKGICSYHGSAQQLVPFLSSVGLECPETYNPADYVMEILNGEYGEYVQMLSDAVKNGKNCKSDPHSFSTSSTNGFSQCQTGVPLDANLSSMEFPTSGLKQFSILLHRKWLQMYRNKTSLWIQLFYLVILTTLMSGIYYKVGNDGGAPFTNIKFNMCVIMSLVYTHMMTHVLTFPPEVKLLKREYFNRWYGLKAYYMAFTFSTLPNLVLFSIFLVAPMYYFSDQPLELSRILMFISISLLSAAVAEGYGIMVGSGCSILEGTVIAPSTFCPLMMIAIHGLGYGTQVTPIWNFLMSFDFLRYSYAGLCLTLYSYDRPYLHCAEEYCHYQSPKILLRDLGMEESSTVVQVAGLLAFLIFYRIVAYLMLRYRLTFELSHQILNITSKVLHYKRTNE